MSAINTVYKIYNGSSWQEYYFKTIASQVLETNQKQFVSGNIKVNGKSFAIASGQTYFSVTINGGDIVSNATAPSGHTLQYISANDTIASALGKLDKAAKDAYDNVPSGIVTTTNWIDSIATIYSLNSTQKGYENTALSVLWELVNGGDGVIGWYDTGFTKYTDLTSFVDLTGKLDNGITINSKTINNSNKTITLYGHDLELSSTDNTKIDDAIYALQGALQGAVSGYSISTSGITPTTTYANNLFANDTQTLTINFGQSGQPTKIKDTSGNDINLSSLKVGDDIFLEDSNYPDRWVSAKTAASVTFSIRVEARQPWSSITNTPTTISGYGITDAKINNGTITLGSNTITPLTSVSVPSTVPTLSWGGETTIGTVQGNNFKVKMPAQPSYTDTKNTAGTTNKANTKLFLAGAETQDTNPQTFSNVNCYVGTDNCLYSNGKRTVSIVAGTTAPSNPVAGDIWLDTTV